MFVRVMNIDDNSPQLSQLEFFVVENFAPSMTLSYFLPLTYDLDNMAVDKNILFTSRKLLLESYTYKLLPIEARTPTADLPFHVDLYTGRLTTTRSLNREINDHYEMKLLILGKNEGRSSSIDIVVRVLDQNDQPPIAQNRTVLVIRPEVDNLEPSLICHLENFGVDASDSNTCLQIDNKSMSNKLSSYDPAYTITGDCSLYSVHANAGNSSLTSMLRDGGHIDPIAQTSSSSPNAPFNINIQVHTYAAHELGQCIAVSVERPDLSAYYNDIIHFVLNIAGVQLYPVELTSSRDHPAFLLFFGRRANTTNRLLSHEELKRRIDQSKQGLERLLASRLTIVDPRSCNGGCFNGGRCELLTDTQHPRPTMRWLHLDNGITIATRNNSLRYACACPAQFEGVKCESSVSKVHCKSCGNGVCCRSSEQPSSSSTRLLGDVGGEVDNSTTGASSKYISQGSGDNSKEWACMCNHGWKGKHCEDDINECLEDGICSNRGVCVNLIGSHNCTCNPG